MCMLIMTCITDIAGRTGDVKIRRPGRPARGSEGRQSAQPMDAPSHVPSLWMCELIGHTFMKQQVHGTRLLLLKLN